MPKLLDTSVPLPDPMTLVTGEVQVHEFIEEARQAIVANNNGTEPNASIYLKLFRARWRDVPVLGPLLNRLTAAEANTIPNLITVIENALYPNGQRDVHHRKIAQYNARIQRVVEHQGAYYPERVLAYMEDKRRLVAQIPDGQRPDEGKQIFDLAEGTITLPPVLPAVSMPHPVYMTHAYAGGVHGLPPPPPPAPPSLRDDLVAFGSTLQTSLQNSISQLEAQIHTVFTTGTGKSTGGDRGDDEEEPQPVYNRGRYNHYGGGHGGQGRGRGNRGGRGGRGGQKRGGQQSNNRLYCPDCDVFGHDESDCWGECSVCHRRGHKSEDCYQRKSNGKRPADSGLNIDDLIQKLGQQMASTQAAAQQQKKQRREVDRLARDALRETEDEEA